MSKGSRNERKAVDLFKQAGFAPYRPATVRFGENDMWGLFDVLAVSPDCPRVFAVQVKSNKAVGINAFRRQTWLFRRLGFQTEYWVPIDYKGWRIIRVLDDTHETVVDEREEDCNVGEGVVAYLRGEQIEDV